MPKHRDPLTDKQKKYINAYVTKGVTKKEAAKLAGYSDKTATSSIEVKDNVKNALAAALYKAGVSEEYLADKLKEGTNANQTKFFSFEGRVIEEKNVADYDVREKYIKDILEVMGFIRNNNIENLNIGLISLPTEKTDLEWENSVSNAEKSASPIKNTVADISKTIENK